MSSAAQASSRSAEVTAATAWTYPGAVVDLPRSFAHC
jgi:hypothetical protein